MAALGKYEIPFRCELNENFDIIIHGFQKARFLGQYKNSNDLYVYLSDKQPTKTQAQVAFWWGVLIKTIREWLIETTGKAPTPKLLHIHICTRVLDLPLHEVEIEGHSYLDTERFSLSKAGIGDVSAAIEEVIKHYNEKGVIFPEPKSTFSDY